jgi:hypothetical protein
MVAAYQTVDAGPARALVMSAKRPIGSSQLHLRAAFTVKDW